MDAAPTPPLGVAVEAPAAAPPPPPAWTAAAEAGWPSRPTPSVAAAPPAAPPWPRSAQVVTAALLVLALGLLGWHVLAAQRWMARPTTPEPDSAPAFRVDLNRADRAELLQLPGVGDALAGRILEYRTANGGFRSVDELRHVLGVGPAMLERVRPFVSVERSERENDPAPSKEAPLPPAARPIAGANRPAVKAGAVSRKAAELRGPVDVNAASAEELQRLPGVGPKMAARILQARGERPFRSVEDLRRVPGIGPKSLERLRPHVTVTADVRPAAP